MKSAKKKIVGLSKITLTIRANPVVPLSTTGHNTLQYMSTIVFLCTQWHRKYMSTTVFYVLNGTVNTGLSTKTDFYRRPKYYIACYYNHVILVKIMNIN